MLTETHRVEYCKFAPSISCKRNSDCNALNYCRVCFCMGCTLATCIGSKNKEEKKMSGNEEMDALDACVFSGELLYVNLASFKEYLARWNRAVEAHEKSEKEEV